MVQISIMLRADTVEALRALAALEERPYGQVARRLLELATETGHAAPAVVAELEKVKDRLRGPKKSAERGGFERDDVSSAESSDPPDPLASQRAA